MLPTALSEVLGISLADVMRLYFNGPEDSVQVRHVEEALDRQRMAQEGEKWLVREASRLTLELEHSHEGIDDMF
jgi:hypothetical protein